MYIWMCVPIRVSAVHVYDNDEGTTKIQVSACIFRTLHDDWSEAQWPRHHGPSNHFAFQFGHCAMHVDLCQVAGYKYCKSSVPLFTFWNINFWLVLLCACMMNFELAFWTLCLWHRAPRPSSLPMRTALILDLRVHLRYIQPITCLPGTNESFPTAHFAVIHECNHPPFCRSVGAFVVFVCPSFLLPSQARAR